jgi:AcrR family transcriptional regulator
MICAGPARMRQQVLKLKQRRSQVRRARILAAATRLFGQRGIDRASLTDIARAARIPLPSLYDYFSTKQALVVAVPEENFNALYAELQAQLADGNSDPAEQIRATYLLNFDYIRRSPAWGRVFFLEIWPSVSAREPGIRASVDRYARHYLRLIEQAISSGHYRADLDPRLAMTVLMGAMCQLAAVWLLYDEPFDLVAKASALFTTIEPAFLARRPWERRF